MASILPSSLRVTIQSQFVHALGNLTLMGYNSQLSNLSFECERSRIDSKGNYIGYMDGLNINEDLRDASSWDRTVIEERTEKLVAMALETFRLQL